MRRHTMLLMLLQHCCHHIHAMFFFELFYFLYALFRLMLSFHAFFFFFHDDFAPYTHTTEQYVHTQNVINRLTTIHTAQNNMPDATRAAAPFAADTLRLCLRCFFRFDATLLNELEYRRYNTMMPYGVLC